MLNHGVDVTIAQNKKAKREAFFGDGFGFGGSDVRSADGCERQHGYERGGEDSFCFHLCVFLVVVFRDGAEAFLSSCHFGIWQSNRTFGQGIAAIALTQRIP